MCSIACFSQLPTSRRQHASIPLAAAQQAAPAAVLPQWAGGPVKVGPHPNPLHPAEPQVAMRPEPAAVAP